MAVEPIRVYEAGQPEPMLGSAGVDGESYESYQLAYAGGPDVNPALSGRLKYAVYNEMRRSDPAIAGLLWLEKLPIRQAVWDLDPASDDGEDILVRDAIARQFGLMGEDGALDLTWDNQLAQSLLMLDWGAMFEELIWADLEEWQFDDQTITIRPLSRLAPRAPSSIKLITEDAQRGTILQIEQDLPGARPIPGDKLTWHVFEREGRNWYGSSFLRPCYGPWRLKRALLVSSAIAWDRWASGIPWIKHPVDPKSEARAKEIGRSVRTHERAYVATPATEEWDFEIVTAGGLVDPTPILHLYDEQIAIRAIQQFSLLGRTGSGSRAVGDVQAQPYYEGLRTIANEIAVTKTQQVFRRFVDVNFGTQYKLPTLRFSKLSPQSPATLAQALANLASAGFTFQDRDAQNDVRSLFELPELPEPTANALDQLSPEDAAAIEAAGGVVAAPPSLPVQPAALRAAADAQAAREGSGLTASTR